MDDDFDVDDIDVDAIVARHHALEQKAHQKLREHWGYTEFRDNQLDALQAVLRGSDGGWLSHPLDHRRRGDAIGRQSGLMLR